MDIVFTIVGSMLSVGVEDIDGAWLTPAVGVDEGIWTPEPLGSDVPIVLAQTGTEQVQEQLGSMFKSSNKVALVAVSMTTNRVASKAQPNTSIIVVLKLPQCAKEMLWKLIYVGDLNARPHSEPFEFWGSSKPLENHPIQIFLLDEIPHRWTHFFGSASCLR